MLNKNLSEIILRVLSLWLACIVSAEAYFETCDLRKTLSVEQPTLLYNTIIDPNSSCRYQITAPLDNVVVANCNITFEKTGADCDKQFFYISKTGETNMQEAQYYCGSGSLTEKSLFRTMTIAYTSNGAATQQSDFECTFSMEPQPCDCGWSVNTKIVGGTDAGVNEYPSMAALAYMETGSIFCGAAIVSHFFLVTVAQCSHEPNQIMAVVGEHDTSTGSDTSYATIHLVAEMITHENYNAETLENDIAIIRTQSAINWSRGVGPICIPPPSLLDIDIGTNVDIMGWGTNSFGGVTSRTLRKYTAVMTGNFLCNAAYLGTNTIIRPSQLCTTAVNSNFCQLDIGVPVIKRKSRMYLMGCTSFNSKCGIRPGVSTRISSYLSWIERNTQGTTCTR